MKSEIFYHSILLSARHLIGRAQPIRWNLTTVNDKKEFSIIFPCRKLKLGHPIPEFSRDFSISIFGLPHTIYLYIIYLIYSEKATNFTKSLPIICPMYCQSNNLRRFCKIWWPSENIWTLMTLQNSWKMINLLKDILQNYFFWLTRKMNKLRLNFVTFFIQVKSYHANLWSATAKKGWVRIMLQQLWGPASQKNILGIQAMAVRVVEFSKSDKILSHFFHWRIPI